MERALVGNYRTIASQFLRALRGSRSQRAFARRLGYIANPITDWEHGRRVPTVGTALRAAQSVGVVVADAFARFHPAAVTVSAPSWRIGEWMNAIRGATRIGELAARSSLSRFAVARWIAGKSEPRLHEFFSYVDAATGRLYALVGEIVDIEYVPALRSRYEHAAAVRSAAADAPWTEAVLRALEMPGYRILTTHREGVLARILGIPLAQEKRALAVLRTMGAIRRRNGIYRCVDETSVDMRGDVQRINTLLRHWAEVGVNRLEQRRGTDLFAYSISALSEEDATRAKEILRDAFRAIRSLANASKSSERVMLLNLQLLMLDHS